MSTLRFLIIFYLWPVHIFSQLSVQEIIGMQNLSTPRVSKSGILYVKTTKDTWDGQLRSSIILSDMMGQKEKDLTSGHFDYDPKWSPDENHIAFVSYRDNLQQVYTMSKSGGIPKMASDAQAFISGYCWYNDYTIAYVDDEPRDTMLTTKEKENGGGYVVGTEFYTNALWLSDIRTRSKKKITKGDFRIIEFDISRDGKKLAIVGARNYDSYEAITRSWVKVFEIESGRELYQFDEANSINNIRFAPSGDQISFAGSTSGYASNDGLFLGEIRTGLTKNLTYEFDPTIGKTQWISDTNLVFSTPKNGYTGLYATGPSAKIRALVEPHWVIYDFQIFEDRILFTASRSSVPTQLYSLNLNDKPTRAIQLTHINPGLIQKTRPSSSVFDYPSSDDVSVQGILTFPVNYDSTTTYPLMTIPHGGPDAIIMDDFNWEGQFFANHGYVVFQPNFRGSIGFGRQFYAGNRGAFGKADFEDIMTGIDTLIALGIADKDKLVIGGWSYGGYISNWAVTQTNRFKAAISVAGISNLVSLYGQHEFSNREIGIWEYRGLLIDSVDNYRRSSPIFYVKEAETPLLILHGDRDTRSPTLQAWEMYRAMKDASKNVEMIIYPGAGHNISNAIHRASVLNNWLRWANRHVGLE